MNLSAEKLALAIVQRLGQAGFVAYWAGGCVRDRLMGLVPKDYDVATAARPEQVLGLFPRGQKVGVAFGVVLIRERDVQMEVATFRADGVYSDGRHPDAVEFTTAEKDAQRRDFTCNGLFFDPLKEVLHDFVGGQRDIQGRVLRAIGDPRQRFGEDHLRLLRAVRFAAKLEFAIDPATFGAMRELAGQIRTISKERVHDELARILEHPRRAVGVKLLQESQLLMHLWPDKLRTSFREKRRTLSRLDRDADFAMALAAMHLDLQGGNPQSEEERVSVAGAAGVADLLRRELLLSNVETSDVAWLLGHLAALGQWRSATKARLKRLAADPRWSRLERLYAAYTAKDAQVHGLRARVEELRAEGVAPEPFVTGEELIRLGAAPGPAFKQWLEALYDRQLEGEFTGREMALAAAEKLIGAAKSSRS